LFQERPGKGVGRHTTTYEAGCTNNTENSSGTNKIISQTDIQGTIANTATALKEPWSNTTMELITE